jgi:hypothetical protein
MVKQLLLYDDIRSNSVDGGCYITKKRSNNRKLTKKRSKK